MESMVEKLRKYLATASKEQLDKDYEELKKWNDVGPSADEYIKCITEQTALNQKLAEEMCKVLHLKEASIKNALFLMAEKKDEELYEFLERERIKYKHLLENSPVQDEDYRLGCLNTVEYIKSAWRNNSQTIVSEEGSVLEINPCLSGAASHGGE